MGWVCNILSVNYRYESRRLASCLGYYANDAAIADISGPGSCLEILVELYSAEVNLPRPRVSLQLS